MGISVWDVVVVVACVPVGLLVALVAGRRVPSMQSEDPQEQVHEAWEDEGRRGDS
jgi:hypothetical protein